jgi:hypothetical protein
MNNALGCLGFIAFTALGVGIVGAITHFVLATIFGLSVSFGQSLGIGVILMLIFGQSSR